MALLMHAPKDVLLAALAKRIKPERRKLGKKSRLVHAAWPQKSAMETLELPTLPE